MFFFMFDSAISLPIEDLGASNHPSSMVPIGNDTLYSLITSAAPSRPIILSFSEPQHLLSYLSISLQKINIIVVVMVRPIVDNEKSNDNQKNYRRLRTTTMMMMVMIMDRDRVNMIIKVSSFLSSNPNHTFFPTSSRLYLNQTLNRCSDKQTYFLLSPYVLSHSLSSPINSSILLCSVQLSNLICFIQP